MEQAERRNRAECGLQLKISGRCHRTRPLGDSPAAGAGDRRSGYRDGPCAGGDRARPGGHSEHISFGAAVKRSRLNLNILTGCPKTRSNRSLTVVGLQNATVRPSNSVPGVLVSLGTSTTLSFLPISRDVNERCCLSRGYLLSGFETFA